MGLGHISLTSLGTTTDPSGPLAKETSIENGIIWLFSEGASLKWEIILVYRLK